MQLRPLAFVIVLVSASFLCSCASERVKEQARKEKANKDQYVDYYPVGSNIPIKISKDDPRAKASTEETERTQQVFREVQAAGVKTPSDNPPPTGR